MKGISAIIKETPQGSLAPFHHVRAQQEVTGYDPGGGNLTRMSACWCLDLRLPDSTIVRNKFLLFVSSQSMVFCDSSWNRVKTRTKYEVPGTIIAKIGRQINLVKTGGALIEDGHLKCLFSGGRMKMPVCFCVSCGYLCHWLRMKKPQKCI